MGSESPSSEGPSGLLVALAAAGALVFVAFFPDCVWAHGGEEHGGEPAETVETADDGHGHPSTAPAELEEEAPLHHPYPPDGVPRLLAWFGKFHPVATHFPMALLSVAALGELLFLSQRRELYQHAVRFCVFAGTIGALVAAPLGWFFAGFRIVDEDWVMTAHRWAGTGLALGAVPLLLLSERAARDGQDRGAFRAALFLGAALVGVTGFLGGSLLYGLDHYSW